MHSSHIYDLQLLIFGVHIHCFAPEAFKFRQRCIVEFRFFAFTFACILYPVPFGRLNKCFAMSALRPGSECRSLMEMNLASVWICLDRYA